MERWLRPGDWASCNGRKHPDQSLEGRHRRCRKFLGARPGCDWHNCHVTDAALIVHILFASAWFGHKLLVPRDVRVSVRQEESAGYLIERMGRAQRLGVVSGLGTLATGLWLMELTTGITDAAVETYIALGAVIAILVVGATATQPAWKRVRKAIEAGDIPAAAGGAGRFNRAINLESLLWVFALTMMVIR